MEHFNAAYERIRDRSTTSIIERAQIDGEFDAGNIPAFSPARKTSSQKVILVEDRPQEPSNVHKAVRSRPPRRYGGISSAVETKGGVAKIDRTAAQRAVRYVKSNSRTQEETIWYYRALVDAFRAAGVLEDLVEELDEVVGDIEELAA